MPAWRAAGVLHARARPWTPRRATGVADKDSSRPADERPPSPCTPRGLLGAQPLCASASSLHIPASAAILAVMLKATRPADSCRVSCGLRGACTRNQGHGRGCAYCPAIIKSSLRTLCCGVVVCCPACRDKEHVCANVDPLCKLDDEQLLAGCGEKEVRDEAAGCGKHGASAHSPRLLRLIAEACVRRDRAAAHAGQQRQQRGNSASPRGRAAAGECSDADPVPACTTAARSSSSCCCSTSRSRSSSTWHCRGGG